MPRRRRPRPHRGACRTRDRGRNPVESSARRAARRTSRRPSRGRPCRSGSGHSSILAPTARQRRRGGARSRTERVRRWPPSRRGRLPGSRSHATPRISGPGGLDDHGLAQGLQAFGLLVDEQVLSTASFAERAERRDLVGREAEASQEVGVEAVHGGPIRCGDPVTVIALRHPAKR